MKTNIGTDFRKLRWHLPALVALLAAAAALALWSQALAERSRLDRDRANAQFRQTDGKLRQVRIEEQEIKDKSALFLHLTAIGIIGEERRLDWTEMLRESQRQLRLTQMSYEFAPQTLLEGNGNTDYAFYVSPMKIHLQLVHEEDLINFLAMVQKNAKAAVAIRSCNLNRPAGSPIGQLSADCELDWITARGLGSAAAK